MFEALKRYKVKYGSFAVPYTYENEEDLPRKLSAWVYDQRSKIPKKAKEGTQPFVERKRRLDAIEFVWEHDVAYENWMKMFTQLQQYHEENGNCRVPSGFQDAVAGLPAKLSNWVSVQKSMVPKKSQDGDPIFVERKRLLDSLDFEFDGVHEARWETMFERLKQFHHDNGHCRVTTTQDDDTDVVSLSTLARNQRLCVMKKAESGDPKYVERKRLLDSLNFEYDRLDDIRWMEMYELLKIFAEEHGHCDVPLSYGRDDDDAPRALGRWCHDQRTNIPEGLANPKAHYDYAERKSMLDSLGFPWVVESEKDKRWNVFFERLKKFKEVHGHCLVSPDSGETDDESSLYSWTRNQGRIILPKAERGDHTYLKRKELLDSIGFEWKRIVDDAWEKMFSAIVKYKEKNGHCRVPYRGKGAVDGPSGQLGIWVYRQRTSIPQKIKMGDPIHIERKKRLDEIGFEWMDVHSEKWEVMFAGLVRFHKQHGHCRVKREYKDTSDPLPSSLGSWLSTQRQKIPEQIQQGDETAKTRKERLDALGFVWQTRAPPKPYQRGGKLIAATTSQPSKSGTKLHSKPSTETDSGTDADSVCGAPGPDDTFVAFPIYAGLEQPVMWQKAFGQFRRRHN